MLAFGFVVVPALVSEHGIRAAEPEHVVESARRAIALRAVLPRLRCRGLYMPGSR
jgi:hypothetical protein